MAAQPDIRAPLHDNKGPHGTTVRNVPPKSIPFVKRALDAGNY